MNAVRLIRTVLWDLRLQVKYRIVAVAMVVTLLYTGIFKLLVRDEFDEVLVLLIFTDPAMIGFIFIGALVLFEKSSNTLDAVIVSPLSIREYLLSKVISLAVIATVAALLMAMAGHGIRFRYFYFLYAITFTSATVTLLGFAGAARIQTFNQYFIIIPIFLTPLALPLLNFFHLTNSLLLYIIPTQATLELLRASFDSAELRELVYAFVYLPLSFLLSLYYAEYSFRRHLILAGKT
jgi:fluoroquinolone transport system permease protein